MHSTTYLHPETVDAVAIALYQEWEDLYKLCNIDLELLKQGLQKQPKDQLPVQVVFYQGNSLIATLGLDIEPDIDGTVATPGQPWITSVYVFPEYRGKGLAKRLIEIAINLITRMGYQELYLWTDNLTKVYQSMGFELIESGRAYGSRSVDVLKKTIDKTTCDYIFPLHLPVSDIVPNYP